MESGEGGPEPTHKEARATRASLAGKDALALPQALSTVPEKTRPWLTQPPANGR